MSLATKVVSSAGDLWQKARQGRRAWIGAGCATALILLSLLFVPLDGRPHADWLQFLGRFHPLLVHLPIGLIVLLPVLETLGIRRPSLREAAGLVLQFALATCLVAILFGLLLAYGSGESGTTVTLHLRGGVLLAIELIVLCGGSTYLAADTSLGYVLPPTGYASTNPYMDSPSGWFAYSWQRLLNPLHATYTQKICCAECSLVSSEFFFRQAYLSSSRHEMRFMSWHE